jgi:hypothetical protein
MNAVAAAPSTNIAARTRYHHRHNRQLAMPYHSKHPPSVLLHPTSTPNRGFNSVVNAPAPESYCYDTSTNTLAIGETNATNIYEHTTPYNHIFATALLQW